MAECLDDRQGKFLVGFAACELADRGIQDPATFLPGPGLLERYILDELKQFTP